MQLEAFCKVTLVLELNTSTLTGLTCQSDHGSIETLFSKKCQYQMGLSKDKLDDIIFELVLAQSINYLNSCFESLMDSKNGNLSSIFTFILVTRHIRSSVSSPRFI